MAKLQVGRKDGKKGSKKAVVWKQASSGGFGKLTHRLSQEHTFFLEDFEKTYILRCDASDIAIVAVLAPVIDDKQQPDGLYSRFLGLRSAQLGCEAEGNVCRLGCPPNWTGVINLQPVLVTTDHRDLEH